MKKKKKKLYNSRRRQVEQRKSQLITAKGTAKTGERGDVISEHAKEVT